MVERLKDQQILSNRKSFSKQTSESSRNRESFLGIKQESQNRQKHNREDLIDLSESAKRVLSLLKKAKQIAQELQRQNVNKLLSLRLMNLVIGLRYLLQEEENDVVWDSKDFEAISEDIIDSVSVETVKLYHETVTPFWIRVSSFRFAPRLDNKGYDLTGFDCDLFISTADDSRIVDSCKTWFCSLPPYPTEFPPLTLDYDHLLDLLGNVFFDAEIETQEGQKVLSLLVKSVIFDSSQPHSPLTLGGITLKDSPSSDETQVSLLR